MKVIIAGGRDNHDREVVIDAVIASQFGITEVVSGCAAGIDTGGIIWARANNRPLKRFPAQWTQLGDDAGKIRNEQMAAYADALIAIWDGKSDGTRDMIDRARVHGLKIYIHRVES